MTETIPVGKPKVEPIEFAGSSVEEAVETGLRELGLSSHEAVVEVLDRGSRGFLGIGSRTARVQVVPKVSLGPVVRELTEALLQHMGTPGAVEVKQVGRMVEVRISAGANDGLLIGRKGETLEALQHVILRMAGKRLPDRLGTISVDVSGYRERREERLVKLAGALAERVRRTGRRAMTEPLTPADRRVIHRALSDEDGVTTHAGGSGMTKRVIITPRLGSRPRGR